MTGNRPPGNPLLASPTRTALADVAVASTHTGSLTADAINTFQQSLTGYITSIVDGDAQSIVPNSPNAAQAQHNA